MRFSDVKNSPDREVTKLGQVAFDDARLFVLDKKDYIVHDINRGSIESAQIEMRSSFKHPVTGIIVAAILVTGPASAFLGDPLDIAELILGDPTILVMAVFLIFLGLCLFFPAISARKIPWLVINTTYGERAFPLTCEITDEFTEFITSLNTKEGQQARPGWNTLTDH